MVPLRSLISLTTEGAERAWCRHFQTGARAGCMFGAESAGAHGEGPDLRVCVINLAADKERVLREAYRALKPGGRLAVSDVVVRGEVPAEVRRSVELWIGCVAGALQETEYRAELQSAGFEGIEVEPTRVYRAEESREFLAAGLDADKLAGQIDGRFFSAFIRAIKPARSGRIQ